MGDRNNHELIKPGFPGHCFQVYSGDALLGLCQCLQRIHILEPYAAASEAQSADAFEVVQLAIHDFAGGSDGKGDFIVCHFYGRSIFTRTVEFADQQIQ